ncbi:myb/SANT-like DNA-binding domain-containing protein 3 [Periplaneta americana]|uniref:myb/SANT-like DNA-binding domain-containing protein 3 n=1 Tax=Periplaneta americana TaxID=6978 RepID=UPI0037E87B01
MEAAAHKLFSAEEKTLLINLIKCKRVIEDKRTDVISLSKKKAAWLEILQEFNSNEAVTKRSLSQLKKCWDNIKTKRKRELAQEMKERMKTGGGPPPPLTSPNPEVDLAVPHLGHHVGYLFDNDADVTETPSDALISRSAESVVLVDTVADIISLPYTQVSTDRPTGTPVSVSEIPAVSLRQDHSDVLTGSDTPVTIQEAIQNRPVASSPRPRSHSNPRRSVMEKELDARLRRHALQLEYDAKLQSLREKELQLLVDDALQKLENSRNEDERKKRAFEAEERRKEERHTLELALLKKKLAE